LKKYTGTVEYHKKTHGRYFGNGLQTCQRDIRKYLADNNYVDIDIENCHPIIIENLMHKYNIKIPDFLIKYNKDRSSVMKEYNIDNKLYIIKLINNQICFDTRPDIIHFHNCIYKSLVPKLIQVYPTIKIKQSDNSLGSFLSTVLQELENDILMVMFKKCKQLKVKIGVLIFDGMMIEKQTYFPDLLHLLQNEIYLKLKFFIKLTEKSMNTDWVPNKPFDKNTTDNLLIQELDIISSKSSINIHDIKHLEIFNRTNKLIEAFMNATGIEPIHNLLFFCCFPLALLL
jgi:hypothetical protein